MKNFQVGPRRTSATEVASLVLVFVLPLAVSRLAAGQFILPKLVLLGLISGLLLVVWSARLFAGRERLRWHPVLSLFAGFILLASAATLTSIQPAVSFLGKYGRYEGLLTLFSYAALLLVAFHKEWDDTKVHRLLATAVAAGVIVALYGLVQFFGYDPVFWGEIKFGANRAFSTFGNPSLLTGYLVIVMFLALGLAVRRDKVSSFWLSCTVIIALALFATLTRGGWLAGLAGMILFVGFSWKSLTAPARRSILFTFTVMFLMFLVLGYYTGSGEDQVSVAERLSSAASGSGSIAQRVEIWKTALNAAISRPWLGWGPDTFRWVFMGDMTDRYVYLSGPRQLEDNAHNYFLQIASTMGLPAALLFFVGVAWIVYTALRQSRAKDDRLMLASGVAIVAYIINISFTVNVIGSAFLLWLLLGVMLSRSTPVVAASIGLVARPVILFISLALALAMFFFPLAEFTADAAYRRASGHLNSGQIEVGLSNLRTAFSLNPWLDKYHFYLGKAYFDRALTGGRLDDYALARRHFTAALDRNNFDVDNYAMLAQVDLFALEQRRGGDPDRARALLDRLLQIQPNSPTARYLLAAIAFNQGDFTGAETRLREAVSLYPAYGDAHELLGLTLEKLGRENEAAAAFEKAVDSNPDLEEARNRLSALRTKN